MNKKAKQQGVYITIIIIAVLVVLGMLLQKNFGLFSLLSTGYNAYPNQEICTFTTNVDPITSRYSDYRNSGVWMAIDVNNDGIKEKWGYRVKPSSVGTSRVEECNTAKGAILLVENYNSYGDDIYYFPTDSSLWGTTTINICKESGSDYSKFSLNYGSASNAISCLPSITITSLTYTLEPDSFITEVKWSGGNYPYTVNWQINGNTGTSNINAYSLQDSFTVEAVSTKIYTGQVCINGVCKTISYTATCKNFADTNCDGFVSRDELGVAINSWMTNSITRDQLGEAIQAWMVG
jgi:hypothetical protein